MKKLKVTVISSAVFVIGQNGARGLTHYGGLEQIAWECAAGLADKGHEVTLIAPDLSECPNVRVIHCGPAGRVGEHHMYGGFPELKERQGDKDVVVRAAHRGYWQDLLDQDVIIDHSWNKYPYQLKAEGKLKAPSLSVMHAPVNTMFPSLTLPPGIDKPCIVCISDDQRQHFEALFEHEARTAYNGCDTTFYQPLNIKRSNRFLFLARFSAIKGPDIAIRACKEAGVGLDLIGDTSITNEPDYYRMCSEMCDGEQIRMVGPCSRGESVWWYSQAYCMLHPTKNFREPFGLAPVEAQLCGCQVVAWDRGAMRETIKNGETGYLVSSEYGMTEMVKHLSRNPIPEGIRRNCRVWASRFSLDAMVSRYEVLCQEAIEHPW